MELLRKDEGITLTVLIITIIILLILASTATYTGIETVQNTRMTVFNAEMKILQEEINECKSKIKIDEENVKKINNKSILEIGQDVPNNNQDIDKMVQNMANIGTIVELESYRYFDSNDLKNDLNIVEIKQIVPVLIDIENASIISIRGVKYQGNIYYKLDQLPDNLNKVRYTEPTAEIPVFDVISETTKDTMKIKLSNIRINSQYVKKYKVQYQANGNRTWATVADNLVNDSYEFYVKSAGNYNVRIVDAKNEESIIKPVEVKNNKTTFDINTNIQDNNKIRKLIISVQSANTNLKRVTVIDPNETQVNFDNSLENKTMENEYLPKVSGTYTIKAEDEYENISELTTVDIAITFNQITPENYGDEINYNVDLDNNDETNDWKIFYQDNNGNTFIIASDYVPVDNNELQQTLTKTDISTDNQYPYSIFWNASEDLTKLGTEDISNEISTKFMFNWGQTSTSPNAKIIAELLDVNAWNDFVDGNIEGVQAIGAPTIEMWKASWNDKEYTTLYSNDENENGYYVGTDSEDTEQLSTTLQNDEDGYNDTLYYPHKSIVNGVSEYWISSPSAYDEDSILKIKCDGIVGYSNYSNTDVGVRPVVCLPSSVMGMRDVEGVWEIVD